MKDEQDLPPELAALMDEMIDTSDSYRVMSLQEAQAEVSRRVSNAFSNLSGNARTPHLSAGMAYFNQHHHLDDWDPKRTSGKAGSEETYWQMQLRHKRERNQCLASSDTPAERIGKAEVAEYIGKGLDDIEAGKRPNVTGYARERGSSARHIRAVQQRDTTRSNAAAFEQHREHPVLKLIADHGKATDMNNGTVTRSLRKVGEQYTLAQRVAALEAQVQRQAELMERRFSIIESGTHWHDVARDLRSQGKGPTAIAELTGQRVNTVKQFLKRERISLTTPTE